jgi:Protein of unknown function (DUF3631)
MRGRAHLAFSAVALAGLGWLPDTILTRSVIVRMRRRGPDEKIMAFRRRVHAPEGHKLRDRLAAWAAQVVKEMTDARPDMPPGIEDRNADVWEPLLAIADGVSEGWPMRARGAAVALVKAAEEAEPSLGLLLLADLKLIFDASTVALKYGGLPTATILERLTELPESPWGDLHGKPINDRVLAKRLKQYGVRSKDVRIEGRVSPLNGYTREDLHDVWRRYLPPKPPSPQAEEARQARQAQQTSENGGSTQESVADGPYPEARQGGDERDAVSDVANTERDGATKRDGNNPTESTPVADVADVADVRPNGGGRICAQCNAGGEPLYPVPGFDLWLHPECRRFWAKANNGLPPGLDRTPPLGPEGDSLDDLQ